MPDDTFAEKYKQRVDGARASAHRDLIEIFKHADLEVSKARRSDESVVVQAVAGDTVAIPAMKNVNHLICSPLMTTRSERDVMQWSLQKI